MADFKSREEKKACAAPTSARQQEMSERLTLSYKLSPNEEAAVLRSQREERRRARLVQVREQEREAARRAREAEKQKREKQKRLIQDNIHSHLEASHAAELAAVEEKYTKVSKHIGLGHRQAQLVQEEERRLYELRLLLAAKQRERAWDRHVVALQEEMCLQESRKGEKKRKMERLRLTREEEGKRGRANATQHSTHPPLIMDLVAGKGRRVRLQEVEGFSSSYYHLPSCTVQRAASLERMGPDAQQMAVLMSEETQALNKQCSAVHEEQKELARLRYMHALNKVKMEKERKELMGQLKTLEREDRALRQKAIASIPSNMYQPVEQRKAVAREQQRDMEQAFERLFVSTTRVSDGPNLRHIPQHPSPPLPSHHEATPPSQSTTDASLLEKSTEIVGSETPDPLSRERVIVSVPSATSVQSASVCTPELSVSELTPSELSPSPQLSSPPLRQFHAHSEEFPTHSEAFPTHSEAFPAQSEEETTGTGHEILTEPLTIENQPTSTTAQPHVASQTHSTVSLSGVKRLVSMVQSQQEAWIQRIADRKDPAGGLATQPPTVSLSPPSLCDLHSLTPSPEPPSPLSSLNTLSVDSGPSSDAPSDSTAFPSPPSLHEDIPVSQPPTIPLTQPYVTPAPLPRPDLSLATLDSDPRRQDSTTSDPGVSLDTTPTHTTLHLPNDERSESEISLLATACQPQSPAPNHSTSLQTAPSLSLPSLTKPTPNLQEAFLRRKMNFVRESQRRLEELKGNARERQTQFSIKQRSQRSPPSPRPGGSGKENERKRIVTFSSPHLCSSHTPCNLFTPPPQHKAPVKPAQPQLSRGKEKISAREMKERNLRFYNRLPEVRRKKVEEKRSATYESNRQKARAYQQQVKAKLQKKPLKIGKTLKKTPFK